MTRDLRNVSHLQEQLRHQLTFKTPKDTLNPTAVPALQHLRSKFGEYYGEQNASIAILTLLELQAAEAAINARAVQLGWVGAALDNAEGAGSGYRRRFEEADIYYSKATGAFEVHGDIRAKYNALGTADGVLGLPLTDETGTPDGVGRYNHFQGGSIYWTPSTGPMMVRGPIRDLWASQGWERGPFGYPVADPDYKVVAHPVANAAEYAGVFQGGALYSKGDQAAPALVAEIQPQGLTDFVRKTFDKAFKDEDEDLGIEGGLKVLDVSNWGYGFWNSRKRMITYEINGFHSNPIVSDTTFRLELQFLFGLAWNSQSFTEPVDKTLVIELKRWHIHTSGIGHGELFDRLKAGILGKFPYAVQTIPAIALLIDVLLTPQGGLQFWLEPDTGFPPIGVFRRDRFQDQLNLLLES